MRNLFRLVIAAATLPFLFIASAGAQAPQWAIAPADGNGHSIRAGFSASHNAHHVAALDASGNLFIAGHFYVDPANPFPESQGQFLGKYDAASGAELWGFAAPIESDLSAVAVNGSGDAFVAGFYVANGIEQHYVARISGATGDVMWEARGLPNDSSETYAVDVVLDASGNPLVLSGSNGRRQAVVTKYDGSTGAVQWSVVPGPDVPATQHPFGLERAANGDIVGYTFYGDTPDAAGSLLFKLDPATGARIWGVPLAYKLTEIVAFTLDPIGKPILAGKVVAKYSNVDGSLIWSRALDTSTTTSFAYDVATRSNGDVYAAGTEGTNSSVPLLVLLRSLDGSEIFFSPDSDVNQTTPSQYARSVAVDINDNAVVAERVFDTSANDYVIATRVVSPSNFPLHARYTPGTGASNGDADLALARLTTPYVIGHFTRPADGVTFTVALEYGATQSVHSTMTLTASPNPAGLGQAVTLTANVSGQAGTPTGTVDFRDGGTVLCPGVALADGTATCNAGTLSPGTHSLNASYSGDGLYSPAGASFTETVQNNPATVSLASSANPATFEQPVTFTASVSGSAGTPTGSAMFKDGGNNIYGCTSVALANGSASCTLNGMVPGAHSISASYSGDGTYDPAASSALGETIQGSIGTTPEAWHVTTTSSPEPFLDKVGPPGTVGPRGGVDAAGNLYVIATTVNQTAPTQVTTCLVVIKYAASTGAVAWRVDKCTSDLSTFGGSLAVDRDGNVLVTGALDGMYIAKLSGATGAPLWERTVSGFQGLGIGLDASGNARVVGYSPANAGATIFAFANADGATQWQTTLPAATPRSFAVGTDGSVAVYQFRINESNDTTDQFITRLDAAGNVAWTVTDGGGEQNLVIDAQGNVIGNGLVGLVKRDVATGAVTWQQSFSGLARPDAQGNVYVAAAQSSDAFFAKIDTAGHVVWSRLLEDPSASFTMGAVNLDSDGNVIAVGYGSSGGQSLRQMTFKIAASDGSLLWMDTLQDLGANESPAGVFAVPQGVLTFGQLIGSGGTDQGLYAALYSQSSPGDNSAAERALITHYYESILRREPDTAGLDFWQGEAERVVGLGANVNETWYAMAMAFFASPEYASFGRDSGSYLTDLYNTFFDRAPDADGFSYWMGQMAAGMPRESVLLQFLFSPEFANFTQSQFGNAQVRPEIDMTMDMYRGILQRLPDNSGFTFFLGQFREAQCSGADAVRSEADSMSQQFFDSPEYGNLQRTNAQYMSDIYNAIMRRGPDLDGIKFWIAQLDSGAQTREQVREQFVASPEFGNRVANVVNAGCMQ